MPLSLSGLVAEQLRVSQAGIGFAFEVGLIGHREPLQGRVPPTGLQQGVGVGVADTDRPRLASRVTQFRNGQQLNGRLGLTKIPTSPGGDDPQFELTGPVQQVRLLAVPQLQRTFRAPQAAFGVGHHRQVCRGTADPAGGPQLGERLLVVPCHVGRHSHGFPYHREPATIRPSGLGMLQGAIGVLLQELPGGHQMSSHSFGRGPRQRAKLSLDLTIELETGDLFRNRRARMFGSTLLRLCPGSLVVAARTSRCAALGRSGTTVADRRAGTPSPVVATGPIRSLISTTVGGTPVGRTVTIAPWLTGVRSGAAVTSLPAPLALPALTGTASPILGIRASAPPLGTALPAASVARSTSTIGPVTAIFAFPPSGRWVVLPGTLRATAIRLGASLRSVRPVSPGLIIRPRVAPASVRLALLFVAIWAVGHGCPLEIRNGFTDQLSRAVAPAFVRRA